LIGADNRSAENASHIWIAPHPEGLEDRKGTGLAAMDLLAALAAPAALRAGVRRRTHCGVDLPLRLSSRID